MKDINLSDTERTCSCREYSTTRRSFLRNAALATGGAVAATMFGDTFRQVAYGAVDSNVLIVLSLRGGADFLSMVVPHAYPGYYAARPKLAIPADTLIAKDQMFGLHPNFAPLQARWAAGQMAAVVATGLPVPNRSHFSAIEEIEDASPDSTVRAGWINRMIGLDTDRSPLQGVMMGSGIIPTELYGAQPTLATDGTDKITLSGSNGSDPDATRRRRKALTQIWQGQASPLGAGARAAFETTTKLAPALAQPYVPANNANYPADSFGDALKDTARLIKARVGVEVATVDFGTWDMHSGVGTLASVNGGSMAGMVTELAAGMDALFTDLVPEASRVTLVTISEFGRRIIENGSGFDHGWANSTLVMGAGVNGGQYYGRWPGMPTQPGINDDVSVTTDYRDVLSEILVRRFNSSIPTVFPGFQQAKPLSFISSA